MLNGSYLHGMNMGTTRSKKCVEDLECKRRQNVEIYLEAKEIFERRDIDFGID